jgi:nucleotide-binding universal stress UspA family protein
MNAGAEPLKILLCSDGGEQAERAVRFGGSIAAACHASATLLGVAESAGESKDLLASLQRSQGDLREKNVPTEMLVAKGSPIEEIIQRSEKAAYGLVVIGAVRKANRGAYWMSSKSYKLIKEIKQPVISVAGRPTGLKRILVCSGGKRYVNEALPLIGCIAAGSGATVCLLHVTPELPPFYAQFPGITQNTEWLLKSETELGRTLRQAKEALSAAGVVAEAKLRKGAVLGEILSEIAEGNYELVVTGSSVSHSLSTYVLGDITREIVNHADCAVLVVRSREKPGAGKGVVSGAWRKWLGKFVEAK